MRLWEKGAYEGLDVCLMYVSSVVPVHVLLNGHTIFELRCHPAPGPPHGASLSGSLAVVQRQVDYTGHT